MFTISYGNFWIHGRCDTPEVRIQSKLTFAIITTRPSLQSAKAFIRTLRRNGLDGVEWSGSPDPNDPDNYWIDDDTGERVSAKTGERTPPQENTQ